MHMWESSLETLAHGHRTPSDTAGSREPAKWLGRHSLHNMYRGTSLRRAAPEEWTHWVSALPRVWAGDPAPGICPYLEDA